MFDCQALSNNPPVVTIRDVAKSADVSTATVSAVLNRSAYVSPALTARVKKAVAELDYSIDEVARSLQTRKTKTMGILVPNISSPHIAEVVRAAEQRLKRSEYSIFLGISYDLLKEQARLLSMFRAKRVDGLLVCPAPGPEDDLVQLVESKRPVVFLARPPRTFEADFVAMDHFRSAQIVTEYLIGKGHSQIGVITLSLALSVSVQRVEGWSKALRKAGLPADPRYVVEAGASPEDARRATLQLLDLDPRPTAIYIGTMATLPGVLGTLRERNLSPDGVQVVMSHDCELLDYTAPPITGLDHSPREMGITAADLLIKRIRHPNRPFEKIVIRPKLNIRA